MDFDYRLKQALTPTYQPDKGLNERILSRVKEQGQMNKRMIWQKTVLAIAMLVCLVSVSAFAYGKFKGDRVLFWTEYQGDGVVAVHVTNSSDQKLVFEEKLKLMKWSGAEIIDSGTENVRFKGVEIPANTEGVMVIDLSGACDSESLEMPLESGDWYYLVLTNNHFAFGQDWMVTVDFSSDGATTMGEAYTELAVEVPEKLQYEGELIISEWVWPTENRVISSPYGKNELNGYFSDHVNISGEKGDSVYAVTEGVIMETGFDGELGNYILLEDVEGRKVKYGHLDKISVDMGQMVDTGDVIGEMGKSGMATGVNLLFAVYENGEPVNPLEELE